MTSSDILIELEVIKHLKARYCRLLDAKDWSAWRDLFTDDFVSDTSESGGKRIEGADAFIRFVAANLGAQHKTTVHHVHAPELELTSPTTATGVWALDDRIRLAPGFTFNGYGHYHERYLKVDGRWRIQASRLTRLREDIETPFFQLQIPDWLKNRMAKSLPRAAAAE